MLLSGAAGLSGQQGGATTQQLPGSSTAAAAGASPPAPMNALTTSNFQFTAGDQLNFSSTSMGMLNNNQRSMQPALFTMDNTPGTSNDSIYHDVVNKTIGPNEMLNYTGGNDTSDDGSRGNGKWSEQEWEQWKRDKNQSSWSNWTDAEWEGWRKNKETGASNGAAEYAGNDNNYSGY